MLDLLQHFFQEIEHIGMQRAASLDAVESVALWLVRSIEGRSRVLASVLCA